jgi:predicted HAD superfamily hydrolase
MSMQESGSERLYATPSFDTNTPYPHLLGDRLSVITPSDGTVFSIDPVNQPHLGYREIDDFLRARKGHSEFTPSNCLIDVFEAEVRNCTVVSFDIFDTLLVRYVDSPFDVFHYLVHEPVFQECGLPREQIARLRAEAERVARAKLAHQVGMDDISITDIYTVFCMQHRIPMGKVMDMVEAEERVELKLCNVNPPLRELYDRAVRSQKTIIYVSDMYHKPEFLKTLLERNGYAVPEGSIFVSSAHRYNKVSGRLFNIVFDSLGVGPAQILHIGDNPHGDRATPKSLGLRTILHEYRTSSERPNFANFKAPCDLQAYVAGMGRMSKVQYPDKDFWWHLGYGAFGPMTVAYCQWLEDRFRQDKIESAYFFLRDMDIVADVFELLYPSEGRGYKTRKLLSSRRAFVFPVAEYFAEIAFSGFGLFYSTQTKPAREFLRRLCIDSDQFQAEFQQVGFKTPDEPISPGEIVKLFDLFRQPRVLKAVLGRSREERPLLVKYLEQEEFFSHSQVAVVELGWAGRLQKALQSLLNQMRLPVSLNGYYFATFDQFFLGQVPNLKHSSFVTHNGQPNDLASSLDRSLRILESIYSSTRGSLLYFQRDGEQVVPVFSGSGLSEQQVHILNEAHNGIKQFTMDFISQREKFPFEKIPAGIAIERYLRLAMNPSPEEALVVGQLIHTENFGSNAAKRIAAFRPESHTVADVWRDLEDSTWREGLINQDNEKSQVLRSVLWKIEKGAL